MEKRYLQYFIRVLLISALVIIHGCGINNKDIHNVSKEDYHSKKGFLNTILGTYELDLTRLSLKNVTRTDKDGIIHSIKGYELREFCERLSEYKEDYRIVITKDYISGNDYGERYYFSTDTMEVDFRYLPGGRIVCEPSYEDEHGIYGGYYLEFNSEYNEILYAFLDIKDEITNEHYNLIEVVMEKID